MISSTDLTLARRDLAEAIRRWPLWLHLAWEDVRVRYQRSTLGPFWITLAMGIHIGALGVFVTLLFRTPPREFLPHLCLGVLIWSLLSRLLAESCTTFIDAASYIRQVRLPLSTYPLWALSRNLIVFLHNAVVYLFVMVWPGVPVNANTAWVLVTLPLAVLSLSWAVFTLGLASVRYRDVPQLVNSLLGVLFYLTPIMWQREQLGSRAYLADWNPLTHIVDIVRMPLLGQAPRLLSLEIVCAVAILGWGLAWVQLARSRTSVAYWL